MMAPFTFEFDALKTLDRHHLAIVVMISAKFSEKGDIAAILGLNPY